MGDLFEFNWRHGWRAVVASVWALGILVTGWDVFRKLSDGEAVRELVLKAWPGHWVVVGLWSVAAVLAWLYVPAMWELCRWLSYTKGATAHELRQAATMRPQGGEQRWILIPLHGGSIALWAHVAKRGEGIRRSSSRYLFAYSAGHTKNTQGALCCRNQFGLAWMDEPEPKWGFRLGTYEGDEISVEVPDDLPEGWHHFVCTWGFDWPAHFGDRARLYIDGRLRDDKPNVRHPDVQGRVALLIGSWTTLRPMHYVEDLVAWVAYYPEVLDGTRVARLHALAPDVVLRAQAKG